MIFKVESGGKLWFIVRCNLASYDADNTKRIVTSIVQQHHQDTILVAIDFNTDLVALEGNIRGMEIVMEIATSGIEDMSAQFLLRHKYWVCYGKTWCIRRHRKEVRSQT